MSRELAETKAAMSEELADTKNAMSGELADTKSAMSEELVATKEAMSEELVSTKSAMSEELAETKDSMSDELNGTEDRVSAQVRSATAAMQDAKNQMDENVAYLKKRLDANAAAHTTANRDYAAEVVDARVSENGHVFGNLGEAIRKTDHVLRVSEKVSLTIPAGELRGENENTSSAVITPVRLNGIVTAAKVNLSYVNSSGQGFIRGYFQIEREKFEEALYGCKPRQSLEDRRAAAWQGHPLHRDSFLERSHFQRNQGRHEADYALTHSHI